jgi:signal transduction histidine kinase
MTQEPEVRFTDHRILVLAPTGRDATLSVAFLEKARLNSTLCRNIAEVVHAIGEGCAALLMAEEALDAASIQTLNCVLEQQPSWSDLPITLITSHRTESERLPQYRKIFSPGANITLLERPFHPGTLVSTLEVAIRARRRQYQIRDLLHERGQHLKQLERRVAERTQDLLELNTHLESLVYTVAHDLRTPLRGIQGYSKLLLDDCASMLDETGKHHLSRIQTAAERMDALVIDLMAYGRIARAEIELTRVHLEDAWTAALAQCETLIENRHARIQALAPFPDVRAHLPTLTQVLANLLNNALSFVREDVLPQISFRTEDAGSNVRAWVEDNGIGIAPEHHERVFRLFERVETLKQPGTGVGLSIVRKGIERMHGKVGLQSALGQGSRFWIELPKPIAQS